MQSHRIEKSGEKNSLSIMKERERRNVKKMKMKTGRRSKIEKQRKWGKVVGENI